MNKYDEFKRIINSSKAYEFHGTVLEITGYYTGKRVLIDLANITEEMFEDIIAEDEEEEEEEEEDYVQAQAETKQDSQERIRTAK